LTEPGRKQLANTVVSVGQRTRDPWLVVVVVVVGHRQRSKHWILAASVVVTIQKPPSSAVTPVIEGHKEGDGRPGPVR
jgi:hypothetical protein